MQGYRYTITYNKGSSNISDYMSRLRNQSNQNETSKYITNYINCVSETAILPSMTLDQIREATECDRELQLLKESYKIRIFHK